jgi:hypothetical protein
MEMPSQSTGGRAAGVYLTRSRETLVSTLQEAIQAELEGLPGDVHYGLTKPAGSREKQYPRGESVRNNRQVSIVSLEELAEVAAAMGLPEIRPEWLGANLALEGIPRLTRLPPFTRLYFPEGAALLVSGENKPCIYPGNILQAQYPDHPGLAEAFVKLALGKRGLVAVVERAGMLRRGDAVRVEIPRQVLYQL